MSQGTEPSPEPKPSSNPEFDRFYRDYRWRLLRFVRQAGHSGGLPEARLDAEGVVQETFEAAFRKWATIQHPERWIYKVATRKIRRRSHQEWLQDLILRQRLQAKCSTGSDSDPVYTHAVAGAIVDRIMELPTNQRIATYLSTVEGWTGPEIAKVLGIAPATAYVHVSRGIKAVRRSEDTRLLSGSTPYTGGRGQYYGPILSPRIRRLLVALVALLLIVGVAGWIYFKLAVWLGILVAGLASVWLVVAVAEWCAQLVSQALWRHRRRRRWELSTKAARNTEGSTPLRGTVPYSTWDSPAGSWHDHRASYGTVRIRALMVFCGVALTVTGAAWADLTLVIGGLVAEVFGIIGLADSAS
ncbi:MAG: RNA polymerase sigma factor [Pseudonocardiaceae bacterium]